MIDFLEWVNRNHPELLESNWIQKAIDSKHKGFCTPMSKKTCTPKRKALAKRFKKGGDLHKKMAGGDAIVSDCKPKKDFQVWGACSEKN